MDAVQLVRRLGGIARTRELAAHGLTRRDTDAAVHTGALLRIRVGWFGLPSLPDHVIRAHRVGGRPACATVAEAHGLWMLNRPNLHVEVSRGESRFRTQDRPREAVRLEGRTDLVVHWVTQESASARSGQPLVTALRRVAHCLPVLEAVCVIDCALQRGLVSVGELGHGADARIESVLSACDGRAESGTESIFRMRASAAGWVFRTQAEIRGGRVDFLFGDRLIVEVDGSEFHSGHDAFVADRRRDAWHAAIGFYVVRFTYAQVVFQWHEVESVLRLLLARGEHLGATRMRRTERRADS